MLERRVGTTIEQVGNFAEQELDNGDQYVHNKAAIGDAILVPEGTYNDTPPPGTYKNFIYDSDMRDSPLTGRNNAIQYLDSDGNGLLVYVGPFGPTMECVTGFGTEDEAPCEEDSFIGPKPLVSRRQLYGVADE